MNENIRMIIIIVIGIYLSICVLLYFLQENLLFFPEKLPSNFEFDFVDEFEEVNIEVEDEIVLNNVHFKSNNSRGVVLFFHGNGGSIYHWGQGSNIYLERGYDVFYVDYRNYGKSGGKIESESQLINDGQIIYDYLRSKYSEEDIIVSGTSIGTGIAVQIASKNRPNKLILNSPYYSLPSLVKEKLFWVPRFIIRYKLRTFKHIKEVECSIIIIHGNEDQLIPIEHANKLKEENPEIDLATIKNCGHNDLFQSYEYLEKMKMILN